MIYLLAFLVVISILIFVHELGHHLAAKSVDIEVERFSIGMGPKVFGFRRGETEYIIGALPIGGYVKMAGMDDAEAIEGSTEPGRQPDGREFDAKPLWARVFVISAGVLMNFLFALVVYAIMSATFGERVVPTTRVAPPETLAGAAAQLDRIPVGAEVVRIGGRTVERWSDVQRTLATAPAGEVTVRFREHDPVMLRLPADDDQRLELLSGFQPLIEPIVGTVLSGSAAETAGLQPGDRIVAIDETPVITWQEVVSTVVDSPGEPLAFTVERAGERVRTEVTPSAERSQDADGRPITVGRIGVMEGYSVSRRYGPLAAVARGAQETWDNSAMVLGVLGGMITGQQSMRQLGGPIAIAQFSGETARLGLEPFLLFMAILSINLAILNLLPIPILDGGQLLFLAIEGVRGRPLSVEQRIRLSHVGLILVVGLMVWAITNDFLRLFGI